MRRLERIAFVDHLSAGGVSRFMLALISHMSALYPDTRITYYVSRANISRDSLDAHFATFANVTLVPLEPPALNPTTQRRSGLIGRAMATLRVAPPLYYMVRWLWRRLRTSIVPPSADWWRYRLPAQVEASLSGYDVVYFGWPFYCEPVETTAPLVATFHDFHFKRFPESYVRPQLELLERETRQWLARCSAAVTSTRFIEADLQSYYGDIAPAVEVVYLAPYSFEHPSPEAITETLARLGVRKPYALYSGGRSGHKNFVAVLEAIGILKEQGAGVHLAITGLGSEDIGTEISAHPADPVHRMNLLVQQYGLERGVDYFPLGYVENADVDALTAGADVVVSASLYEAGCGPANDAWQAGVPVAFSNIPPFLEQIEHFGVRAWIFDPHDPGDVAEKIRSAVFDTEATREMVERSRSAFTTYTWDDVAREYYRVFAEAAERGPRT